MSSKSSIVLSALGNGSICCSKFKLAWRLRTPKHDNGPSLRLAGAFISPSATYLALSWNVYLFMVEEIASARASNVDIQTLFDFVQTYSATIDTAAWLALLLLFELETFVIPDRSLRGLCHLDSSRSAHLYDDYCRHLLGLLFGVDHPYR